jgi:hypothetical protein
MGAVNDPRLPRATRIEILGAWLHVWTPPRDRYVPPPPVRRILIWSAIGLAVAAVVIAVAASLISSLEHAITADAQGRYRRGLLSTRVKSTSCVPFVRPAVPNPPQPLADAREGKYECLGETAEVGGPGGARTGFPFWARVDFRHASWVYCKINRQLGEHSAGTELVVVPLTPACDLLRH